MRGLEAYGVLGYDAMAELRPEHACGGFAYRPPYFPSHCSHASAGTWRYPTEMQTIVLIRPDRTGPVTWTTPSRGRAHGPQDTQTTPWDFSRCVTGAPGERLAENGESRRVGGLRVLTL